MPPLSDRSARTTSFTESEYETCHMIVTFFAIGNLSECPKDKK